MSEIVINIAGKKFETKLDTLRRNSNGILQKLNKQSEVYNEKKDEYFFDRNPKLFHYILEYCRTGKLHLPHDTCGVLIQKELEFWGISQSKIPACCWKPFRGSKYDKELVEAVDEMIDEETKWTMSAGDEKFSIRQKLDNFLTHPQSSKAAKVFTHTLEVNVFENVTYDKLLTV